MKTKNLILPTLVALVMISGSLSVGVTAQDVANPNEVFEMYLLSPNTNEARNTWSALMATELPKAGIGVRDHVSATWDIVGPRTFSYPAFERGIPEGGDAAPGDGIPTHRNAGFDSAFIGLSGALAYDPTGSYSTQTLSPNGLNFAWYQNETVSGWIQDYTQELDTTARNAIAKDIQQALYHQQPYIPLVNTEALWGFDSDLTIDLTDLLMLGTLNYGDQWKSISHPTNPDFVYGHSYDLTEFMPFVQQSYIAAHYMNPIFVGLYERDSSSASYDYYPVLAADQPTWNADNTIANVTINPAATFSDGSPVEAWDVVNTFRMHLTAGASSTLQGDIIPFLTSNQSISLVDEDTIQFQFDAPYFLAQGLMSIGVMDDDVIGNYTSGTQVIYSDNSTTADLGSGPAAAGYNFNADPATYGIGAGPFMYDTSTNIGENGNVRLVKNPNYWNGAVASDSLSFEKYTKQTVLSLIGNNDVANEVHIADAQFGMTQGELDGVSTASSQAVADFGTQFLTINMNHPILGTGVDTPLGQEDPSRAAEAAMYVRKAISHMVPRDTIVNDILEGRGVPGTTLWPNVAAGYDDTLQPYEYSVEKAREMLEKAGYEIVLPQDEQVDTGGLGLDLVPMAFLAFTSSLILRSVLRRRN